MGALRSSLFFVPPLGRTPESFDMLGMDVGIGGIHEIELMIHRCVGESGEVEVVRFVGTPAIGVDGRPLFDVVADRCEEGCGGSVGDSKREAFVGFPTDVPEHPLLWKDATRVILSFGIHGLVYLNDAPGTPDFFVRSALHDSDTEISDCRVPHGSRIFAHFQFSFAPFD